MLTAVIGLVAATSASAALTPIRRDAREAGLPRVRAGVLHPPAARQRGWARVIVRLSAPPLAAWSSSRSLSSASRAHHLDVRSASATTYLAQLARQQDAAAAAVRAAIPSAQIQGRFSILLNGLTVRLPAKSLPKLLRVNAVTKVFPNLSYYSTMDRGPSVIKATDLQAATGDKGQGMKIAVVDTGVDPSSPFLAPAGFAYPAGFPRGDTKLTTPKVIVARSFPGPVRDKLSATAFDKSEPHGTHVSGIAAGDEGTTAPAGPDHPATANLSGVAPKAWIGNYRVFTVPTPLGHQANTPEIVHAFESAVADGMNVINFSGGGAQTDPANDAMYETIRNVALAGVVPVIAAGNDREDFGLGTTGSPGTAPDAIAVAATSNNHVFAPALGVVDGPPSLGAIPLQSAGGAPFPGAWSTLDQTIVDITSVLGKDGKPVESHLCGSATDPNTTLGTLPKGSVTGKILLADRGACTFISKAERALIGGAAGLILIDNRFGEANAIPVRLPLAGGMISGSIVWGLDRILDVARQTYAQSPAAESAAAPPPPAVDATKVSSEGTPFIGDANAPAVMAFWSDYQCPFCRRTEEDVIPLLIANYVKPGKLKILFKDFAFLGPDSLAAGLAARAVWETAPDKFYEWHKSMFDKQDDENAGWGKKEDILALTKTISGIDAAKVEQLMTDRAAAYQTAIRADGTEGSSLGIEGTPGTIIGQRLIVGAAPYEQFKAAVDASLVSQ